MVNACLHTWLCIRQPIYLPTYQPIRWLIYLFIFTIYTLRLEVYNASKHRKAVVVARAQIRAAAGLMKASEQGKGGEREGNRKDIRFFPFGHFLSILDCSLYSNASSLQFYLASVVRLIFKKSRTNLNRLGPAATTNDYHRLECNATYVQGSI